LVGFAGLVPTADGIPNLLYGIGADDCGRGYATEAAQAVIRYAFDVLKLLRVRADVDAPNTASVSVLRKLGMVCVAQTVVKEKPLLTYELSATAGVV
jgi:RimJ/RimL family protein N-acetyltransferase